MKRILSVALALVMLMPITSCGSGNDSGSGSQSGSASSAGDVAIVDENFLTVDITLPASFLGEEDMSSFDPDAYAEERDFKKAVLNEDGSVTITMTKARHREMLDEMAQAIEESYASMVQSEDTPYIMEITYSAPYSQVSVAVDRQGYEEDGLMAAFIPLTIYIPAVYYQMFAAEERSCEITIVDHDTGEVIDSAVYP